MYTVSIFKNILKGLHTFCKQPFLDVLRWKEGVVLRESNLLSIINMSIIFLTPLPPFHLIFWVKGLKIENCRAEPAPKIVRE